ncbi:Hypothetical predicted protein [Octopus vulgaris]|uniref:Uncharacterized protein n=1 Tax=Octopus vulgaris TaxID=6645 RepID=A0AA36BHN4_OCTVU|nr:Hypothetical predicted protein [Octopus vulgaris]
MKEANMEGNRSFFWGAIKQRSAGQVRAIITNKRLSETEFEEMGEIGNGLEEEEVGEEIEEEENLAHPKFLEILKMKLKEALDSVRKSLLRNADEWI